MFFILSKLLYFLIQPLNWIIGLLLFSVFSKKAKWKKKSRNLALILLIFFTNPLLLNLFTKAWQSDVYTVESLGENFDIGIVLGGYSNFRLQPRDRYHFSGSVNRFTQALELYKEGKIKKMLLTGGTGSLWKDVPGEAGEIKRFLIKMGVPEDDIIIESKSRNTRENALFTKEILEKSYPNANCLLITSATHMRRSKGCFNKVGVAFTPFSTDITVEEFRWSLGTTIYPTPDGFNRWGLIIKEWIGYLVYWIVGYV